MAPLIGLIVFVIGVFVSRVAMTRALNMLSDEEKLRLLKGFSERNLYNSAILIVFLVAFVASLYFFSGFFVFEIVIFLLLFLLYLSYSSVMNYRKLIRLSLPREYLKSYLFGTVVVLLSVVAMAVISVFSILPHQID
jgi:hypothetical protein